MWTPIRQGSPCDGNDRAEAAADRRPVPFSGDADPMEILPQSLHRRLESRSRHDIGVVYGKCTLYRRKNTALGGYTAGKKAAREFIGIAVGASFLR